MSPSIPTTMRALKQFSLKAPEDMRAVDDAQVPAPGAGEVLIRVAAAGVNFADLSRAYGTFLNGPTPPCVAGFEGAGEVVACGAGVNGIQRARAWWASGRGHLRST